MSNWEVMCREGLCMGGDSVCGGSVMGRWALVIHPRLSWSSRLFQIHMVRLYKWNLQF